MPATAATFDFNATLGLVSQAFGTVVCTVGFQVASVGLLLAVCIGLMAFLFQRQGRRSGKPLLVVARKLTIFCGILAVPGLVVLSTTGHLPPVNHLELNPFGLVGFWALVIAHLCMEEMNFYWFPEN